MIETVQSNRIDKDSPLTSINELSENNGNSSSLFDLIPKYEKSWIHVPHLLRLNFAILVIFFSATTNGYDSSMLNGLQSLMKWYVDIGTPKAPAMGVLVVSKLIYYISKFYKYSLILIFL